MTHIVKATELNCLSSFMTTDQNNPFQNNAISPNYANYEETHALTCLSKTF